MTHKACSKCKEAKPLSEFILRKTTKDGYDGQCKSCLHTYNREYHKKNKQKRNQQNKEWFVKNTGHRAEYDRNRLYRQYSLRQERFKANPGIQSEMHHRRRAKKLSNGVYKISVKFLKKLYSSTCNNCGSTDRITADHIIPISRGGRHSEGNLQPLCRSCNSRKHAKTMMEWKLSMKFSRV